MALTENQAELFRRYEKFTENVRPERMGEYVGRLLDETGKSALIYKQKHGVTVEEALGKAKGWEMTEEERRYFFKEPL